ncbi:hypothetical protein GCM10009539_60630 [Cryptosporangium japonicum]|uniref:HTH tetR-type domain-containing protein n=1 Tax=Cryptosporangium japonicum TaxID=80872 RepID=A0ABP3EMY6_9ACTN
MDTVPRYGYGVPRVADHEARRRQVAEAVEQLIADDGYDGVTVARTAARAGISVGLVQHYFATKDDMLLHTFTLLRERVERRTMHDADRAGQAGERIEHILVPALREMLPLDERRRRERRVLQAFAGRAVENPRLAEALRASDSHLEGVLARAIGNGKLCGEVVDDVNEADEAALLLAHVDGLAQLLYFDPARSAAESALADHVHRLFPGPCNHPRP